MAKLKKVGLRRPARAWALIMLAALLVGFVAFRVIAYNREREPLGAAARRALAAFLEGDFGTLGSLQAEEELQALKLDAQQFDRVTSWSRTTLDGFVADGAPLEETGSAGYSLLFTQNLRGPGGARTTIELMLYRTPNGPKTFLSKPLVLAALVGKYSGPYSPYSEKTRIWSAIYDGIQKEGQTLRALGLQGIANTGLPVSVASFEQYSSLATRVIAPRRSREGGPQISSPDR